jgi:trans-aconitate methyltransferase
VLQRRTNTAPNRYPGIFRTVRSHVAANHGVNLGEGKLRILSFGCSTGIEVLSIRAYFPDATIFGCDRDPEALHQALRNTRDDACRLFLSTPEAITANGPYDLIFAMSVFCQYPYSKSVSNLESLYPFSLYQKLASNLTDNLREGGLFCIMNSNYLFSALPQSTQFNRLRSPLIPGNGFIDKFARDGKRLTTSYGNKYGYSHHQESEGITDDDLRDCIFKKVPAGSQGGTILNEMDFLRTEQPSGLKMVRSLPDQGENLEKAIVEKRVALAKKRDLYMGNDGNDDLWVRNEWFKTTLAGTIVGFGAWWLPVSRELSDELTSTQAAQPEELRNYLKRERSLVGRLKRIIRR